MAGSMSQLYITKAHLDLEIPRQFEGRVEFLCVTAKITVVAPGALTFRPSTVICLPLFATSLVLSNAVVEGVTSAADESAVNWKDRFSVSFGIRSSQHCLMLRQRHRGRGSLAACSSLHLTLTGVVKAAAHAVNVPVPPAAVSVLVHVYGPPGYLLSCDKALALSDTTCPSSAGTGSPRPTSHPFGPNGSFLSVTVPPAMDTFRVLWATGTVKDVIANDTAEHHVARQVFVDISALTTVGPAGMRCVYAITLDASHCSGQERIHTIGFTIAAPSVLSGDVALGNPVMSARRGDPVECSSAALEDNPKAEDKEDSADVLTALKLHPLKCTAKEDPPLVDSTPYQNAACLPNVTRGVHVASVIGSAVKEWRVASLGSDLQDETMDRLGLFIDVSVPTADDFVIAFVVTVVVDTGAPGGTVTVPFLAVPPPHFSQMLNLPAIDRLTITAGVEAADETEVELSGLFLECLDASLQGGTEAGAPQARSDIAPKMRHLQVDDPDVTWSGSGLTRALAYQSVSMDPHAVVGAAALLIVRPVGAVCSIPTVVQHCSTIISLLSPSSLVIQLNMRLAVASSQFLRVYLPEASSTRICAFPNSLGGYIVLYCAVDNDSVKPAMECFDGIRCLLVPISVAKKHSCDVRIGLLQTRFYLPPPCKLGIAPHKTVTVLQIPVPLFGAPVAIHHVTVQVEETLHTANWSGLPPRSSGPRAIASQWMMSDTPEFYELQSYNVRNLSSREMINRDCEKLEESVQLAAPRRLCKKSAFAVRLPGFLQRGARSAPSSEVLKSPRALAIDGQQTGEQTAGGIQALTLLDLSALSRHAVTHCFGTGGVATFDPEHGTPLFLCCLAARKTATVSPSLDDVLASNSRRCCAMQ